MNQLIQSVNCISVVNNESIEKVNDAINEIYFKQNAIMEYCNDLYKMDEFDVFQEGVVGVRKSKELDLFKFDNHHLMKAIDHFNKARKCFPTLAEMKNVGDKNSINGYKGYFEHLDDFLSNLDDKDNIKQKGLSSSTIKARDEMLKGFDELGKQFDCSFSFIRTKQRGIGTAAAFTSINKNARLTISESKGFKLNGLNIKLQLDIDQAFSMAPPNPKIFGQHFCSVMLHEIFHNISRIVEVNVSGIREQINHIAESKFDSLTNSVSKIKTYVEKIKKLLGLSDKDFDTDQTIKNLQIFCMIKDDEEALNIFKRSLEKSKNTLKNEKELEDAIKRIKKLSKSNRKARRNTVINTLIYIIGIGAGIYVGGVAGVAVGAISAVCLLPTLYIGLLNSLSKIMKWNEGTREELYCDLFASMYQLPPTFNSYYKLYNINKSNKKLVTNYFKALTDYSKSVKDPHPRTVDRDKNAYIAAKQLLDSKRHLNPRVKRYLRYVVANYEELNNLDTHENPKDKRLDKEAYDDINKTLNDLAKQTGINIQETCLFVCDFDGGDYYND